MARAFALLFALAVLCTAFSFAASAQTLPLDMAKRIGASAASSSHAS